MTADTLDTADTPDSPESLNSATTESDLAAWADYPGAVPPDRRRTVDALGAEITVVEWGDRNHPVLLLAHGGADFARTFDVFAPLLAAGGYRVVSWDQRSHGDSQWTALQSWTADFRDSLCVLESCLEANGKMERVFAVGHSKGGGLMTQLCATLPERFHCLVNIDGVPSPRVRSGDPASLEQRIHQREHWFSGFLDRRREAYRAQRRPGTPQELADRRARHNPRLPIEWLRYLVTVGARQDADGWRWKLDPLVRMGTPGPWQPDWGVRTMEAITVPVLAILGGQQEPMGWGTTAKQAAAILPNHAELTVYEDSGHFVHVEHPQRTADRVLQFLEQNHSSPKPSDHIQPRVCEAVSAPPNHADQERTVTGALRSLDLRHGRIRLALHQLSAAKASANSTKKPATPPLLCLHELGKSSQQFLGQSRDTVATWPGEVWALDLSGHGFSDWANGGGYAPESLMADIDAALAALLDDQNSEGHQRSAVVFGKGLGAYGALLIGGARPTLVQALLLDGGAGLAGGGSAPKARQPIALPKDPRAIENRSTHGADSCSWDPSTPGHLAPDPLAIAEFELDSRPEEYARILTRQIAHLNPLAQRLAAEGEQPRLPVWISRMIETKPPWLEAIANQCHWCDDEAAGLDAIRRTLG